MKLNIKSIENIKLKRLFAVEKMKNEIPELLTAVKNSLNFDCYESIEVSELIEMKHGAHRSSRQGVYLTDKDGIEYRITVFGLYRHNIQKVKEPT
jgi:hypothetical protein